MTLKRILFLCVIACAAISAMAYDLAGKTFSGTLSEGRMKANMTVTLRANGTGSVVCSGTGIKTTTIKIARWEESGDYVNVQSVDGVMDYFPIQEFSDGTIALGAKDDYGNVIFWLKEKKTTAKSGTKKRRR